MYSKRHKRSIRIMGFKVSGMEWSTRYKAIMVLLLLSVFLVCFYVFVVGSEPAIPTSLTFRTWGYPDDEKRRHDAISQRTDQTPFGRGRHVHETHLKSGSSGIVKQPDSSEINSVPYLVWLQDAMNHSKHDTSDEMTRYKSVKSSAKKQLKHPASKSESKSSFKNDFGRSDSENRIIPTPRHGQYLIYLCDDVRSCGGWGDRQRGIVGSFSLSVATRRQFGIRMTSPCDFSRFYVPNMVNWIVPKRVLESSNSRRINAMGDGEFKRSLQTEDFNKMYPEDVIFLRINQGLTSALIKSPTYSKIMPSWLHESYSSVFNSVWRVLFKPSLSFQKKFDDLLYQFDMTTPRTLVCAHVRIGRNPTIPNDQDDRNSIQSVYRLWPFLKKYAQQNSSRIFVASDAQQVREMAKSEFGNRLMKVEGKIRHIDRQRSMRDICEGFETALLEQRVLEICDVLVISQSGFSVLAADLRNSNRQLFRFGDGKIAPYTLL